MHHRRTWLTWTILAALSLFSVALLPQLSRAYGSLFDSRCGDCHSDDTITCVGCHRHRGTITAVADQASYAPGEAVTVTLNGGSLGGWIRGLLYDHDGLEIDRATGPTGTGDDGLGPPVTFPVALQGTTPAEAGDYVWTAAWFGAVNTGASHYEQPATVTIHVASGAAAPEPDGARAGMLRITPNPMHDRACLRIEVPSATAARVRIRDASGRLVRRMNDRALAPGIHELTWDGRDEQGRAVVSGAYFVLIEGSGPPLLRQLLVLR